jgi:hypothetical protein
LEGLKISGPSCKAGDQTPPVSGLPFRLSNKFTGLLLTQIDKFPSTPVFGFSKTSTFTFEMDRQFPLSMV